VGRYLEELEIAKSPNSDDLITLKNPKKGHAIVALRGTEFSPISAPSTTIKDLAADAKLSKDSKPS